MAQEPLFRPLLEFDPVKPWHQNDRLKNLGKDTWHEMTAAMEALIRSETGALTEILKGINGIFTETGYEDMHNRVLSKAQILDRENVLALAAKDSSAAMANSKGGNCDAEVKWASISHDAPLRSKLMTVIISMSITMKDGIRRDVQYICSQDHRFFRQWVDVAEQRSRLEDGHSLSDRMNNNSIQHSDPDHTTQSGGQSFSDFSGVTALEDNINQQQQMTYPSFTSGA
jgi:hypothetical protein